MDSVILFADKINDKVGRTIAWFNIVLILVIVYDVFMRYAFGITSAWSIEVEWHLYALIFLLGAGFAFRYDQHVRVDLFYTKFSPVKKAWIDLIGCFIFIIPWCIVIIRAADRYAYYSYTIGETSPDPGGLPARYMIKFAIVLAFVLLLIQTFSIMLKSIAVIRGVRQEVFDSPQ